MPGSARIFCIHGTLSFKCMQSQSCLQHVEDKFGILLTLQVIWKCKALLKQNDSIMKNCIAATVRLPPECLRTTRSVPCRRLTARDGPSKSGQQCKCTCDSIATGVRPLRSPCEYPWSGLRTLRSQVFAITQKDRPLWSTDGKGRPLSFEGIRETFASCRTEQSRIHQ